MIIRPERKTDEAAIRRVNEAAFDQPAEADLVDALRSAGAVIGSLVAEVEAEVVGHILFSPAVIDVYKRQVVTRSSAPDDSARHRALRSAAGRSGGEQTGSAPALSLIHI